MEFKVLPLGFRALESRKDVIVCFQYAHVLENCRLSFSRIHYGVLLQQYNHGTMEAVIIW